MSYPAEQPNFICAVFDAVRTDGSTGHISEVRQCNFFALLVVGSMGKSAYCYECCLPK
jgi:hypothetical protein